MKNSNDKKWTIKDLLVEYTTNQAKKQMAMQQKQMLQEELKQKLLEAQSQNLSQYVPGARQPAPEEMDFEGYAKQGGIHIDPSKRGTFKAQATRMGMSVQEAARHILSNKNKYSPAMVKKANFARNFAKEEGGEMFGMESMGGDDDDRKWWQFWKKDKPMTESDMLSKEINDIDNAIYYLSQKGSVGQSSFNEQANNYYNPYTQRIENLKIKREGLIQKLNSIKSAESDAIAKQKEAKANEDAYNARIKAEQDALKKEAEEKAYQEARKKLKESVNNNQKAYGGQMIKRADGSYSQRGLWDNIRANKGSGKAPTKEMLAQERKIKRKKYNEGGTLPSCEEGYYWNPDKQSCEPIANYSDLNKHQKFLIKMANSPLFEERYNRMIGKKELQIPMQQTEYGPEQMPAEKKRRQMIDNIRTVKFAKPGVGGFEDKNKDADAYYLHIGNLDEFRDAYESEKDWYNNHASKFQKMLPWNKWMLKILEKDLTEAERDHHTIYQREKLETPYNITHELGHATHQGLLPENTKYKMKYRNPYENEPGFEGYKKWFDKEMPHEELKKIFEEKKDYYGRTLEEYGARSKAIEEYGQDKGWWDLINNNFTEKDYHKLIDELFRENEGALEQIKPIILQHTKEEVMSMFNDLVQNKSDKTNNMAKRGGQLGRFLL